MRRSLIAVTLAASISSVQAQAPFVAPATVAASPTQSCSCVAARGEAVTLSNATGRVSVLSNAGFNPVVSASDIAVGSRVMVGPDGGAILSVGRTCALKLGASTDADISVSEGKLCVRAAKSAADSFLAQDRRDQTVVVEPNPGIDPAFLAGGIIILGGIGAGIGIAVSSSSNNNSRFPSFFVAPITP